MLLHLLFKLIVDILIITFNIRFEYNLIQIKQSDSARRNSNRASPKEVALFAKFAADYQLFKFSVCVI